MALGALVLRAAQGAGTISLHDQATRKPSRPSMSVVKNTLDTPLTLKAAPTWHATAKDPATITHSSPVQNPGSKDKQHMLLLQKQQLHA
jgi:hypothetical protein